MHSFSASDLSFGKEDFVSRYFFITIPYNATSGPYCTDIQDFIVNDYVLEGPEEFSVNLVAVSPCGTLGSNLSTVVNIENDDGKLYLILIQI